VTIRRISRDPEGVEALKFYALLNPLVGLGEQTRRTSARLEEFIER
jgi:hypothetical protein